MNLPYHHTTFIYNGHSLPCMVQNTFVQVEREKTTQPIDYTIENNLIILDFVYHSLDLLTIVTAIDGLFNAFDTINEIALPCNISNSTDLILFNNYHSNDYQLQLWCIADGEGRAVVKRSTFYQSNQLSIVTNNHKNNPPVLYQLDNRKNSYHPLRAEKPQGIVYQRYIAWLQSVLTFETFDKDRHLPLLHKWLNDEVVDEFWEEAGSFEQHQAFIDEKLAPHSHTVCLIANLDGKPFGYFEVYWAKEDRIAPFYDADDFDRGWHVLIGEADYRGKDFVTAWMPSISHYMFLADNRTQRLVIEPRIDNEKMKKSLAKCGYAHYKTFDFPHKTAMLGMLSREQFFMRNCLVPLK